MSETPKGWYSQSGVKRLVACNPLHNNPLTTRDDMVRAVKDMVAPLKRWYSPGGARLQIGVSSAHYDIAAAELEGFSRPLWGLIPLAAGGEEFPDLDIYLNGIESGTDPKNPEYWGALKGTDQRMVEMAAFGLALLMIPDQIWSPLTRQTQQNLTRWLTMINDYPTADNNWRFFRVLVNLGLKNVGEPYSKSHLAFDFARLDEFYLSDGWYTDGNWHQLDYYIPFAMHFYALLVSKLAADDFPAQAERYRARASEFAQGFQYWFANDGSSAPFGRSMTYRFSQGAFWSAAAFADVEVLPWPRVKGLLLRHLRWWSQQPITERDGILTVGYAYPNLLVSEQYNAPGSPYWALKAFTALAVAPDHPFWAAKEEPAEELPDGTVTIEPAGFIARRAEGAATLLNAGQDGREHRENAAKYGKFAYSSAFTFSVGSDHSPANRLERHAFDSTMAISFDGKAWYPRAIITDGGIKDGLAYGIWQPRPGVTIESWLGFANPGWHIRIHQITSDTEFEMLETGFAIDRTKDEQTGIEETYDVSNGAVWIRTAFGTSAIIDLSEARAGKAIRAWPNTNLRFPKTAIPQLLTTVETGKHTFVSAVFGKMGENELTSAPELPAVMSTLASKLGVSPKIPRFP